MRSPAKLKEKFIQAVAIDTLAAYYQKYSYNKKVFAEAEVRTKTNKRADGLIVWKSKKRKINVASIEAKSANTLRNLIAKPHQKKILRSSQQLSFATLIGMTMLVFGLGYRFILEPLLTIILLVGSIFLTWSIEKVLQKIQLKRHQKIDVIEQIRQYPANERWIAIGFDSYTKTEQLETLLKKCQANGFGLLIVRDEKVAKMELLPRFENYPTGSNFLRFYKKEEAIKTSIEGNPVFSLSRLSPSQQAYQNRQHTFIFAYLILFMFCSFLYIRPTSKSKAPPPIRDFPITTVPNPPNEAITPKEDSIINNPPVSSPNPIPPPTVACQHNIKGNKYIVKVDLFEREEQAKEKVAALNKLNPGLVSNYFWLPCYKTPSEKEAFCVYVYPPRSHKTKAINNLTRLKYIGKQSELNFGKAEVWEISK